MATNRTESAPPTDEAVASAEETVAAPSGGGGVKPWLPLLVTLVAMPVLAYVMTSLVLVPRLQKALGVPTGTTEVSSKHSKDADGKKESVSLNKLLVNVAGTMGARYLLVSLSVVGTDADFKAKMESHDPQLRDMASGVLATKTLADLEKPAARNLIRSELISGFNTILGGTIVQEIYLTEFAIQ